MLPEQVTDVIHKVFILSVEYYDCMNRVYDGQTWSEKGSIEFETAKNCVTNVKDFWILVLLLLRKMRVIFSY